MNRAQQPLPSVAGLVLIGGILLTATGCTSGPTSEPQHQSGSSVDAQTIAVGASTADGTVIITSASVGNSTFLLGRNGDDIRSAAALDGGNPNDNWSTFGEPAAVPADGVTVANPMHFDDPAPEGLATVTGQVGADVTALDIVTTAGDTVPASVASGYYIAAWAGRDFSDRDTLDADFVLHFADGSTTTVSYLALTEE